MSAKEKLEQAHQHLEEVDAQIAHLDDKLSQAEKNQETVSGQPVPEKEMKEVDRLKDELAQQAQQVKQAETELEAQGPSPKTP